MIILIIGASGSGKGTQASLLAEKLGVPAVSMGDLLRQEIAQGSAAGKRAETYMKDGLWVPAELTFEILRPVLAKCEAGVVLDGFPRLIEQLHMLEKDLAKRQRQLDKVIYLKISDEEAVRRLLKRAEIDRQKTGEARHDDTEAVIRQRLQSFHETAEPILDEAKKKGVLEEVDGERPVEVIHEDILSRLRWTN